MGLLVYYLNHCNLIFCDGFFFLGDIKGDSLCSLPHIVIFFIERKLYYNLNVVLIEKVRIYFDYFSCGIRKMAFNLNF